MTEVIDAESFRPHIDDNTRVISMSQVTFHAGHRFDVESVGRLCKEKASTSWSTSCRASASSRWT